MFPDIVMEQSSKAPEGLRQEVIFQWLQGNSRDEIAKNVGIGAGTVSAILKKYRENDSEFDLLREYIVHMRKCELNIDQLGLAIRIKNRLEKCNWKEEQVETLFDRIEEHRFKERKEIDVFIKEFGEFLEKRPIFRNLQRAEKALAKVTREKNGLVAYLDRIHNRLDDFVLFPNTREMISKIAAEIVESVLKEFQVITTNNQKLNV